MRRTARPFRSLILAALTLLGGISGCAAPSVPARRGQTTLKAELETPAATWIPTVHLSLEMTR